MVEENIVDEFKVIGEDNKAGRFRTQEEMHQKANAALHDEVSTMINSVMQTQSCKPHPPIYTYCSPLKPIMTTLHEGRRPLNPPLIR